MPRYLSQHTLKCLMRQGAEELARRILAAQSVTARRVSTCRNKMFAEFDATTREELKSGWPLRNFISTGSCIEFETFDGTLKAIS